jgi:hypothetical protein
MRSGLICEFFSLFGGLDDEAKAQGGA